MAINLCINPVCHFESQALLTSRNTETVLCLSLKPVDMYSVDRRS